MYNFDGIKKELDTYQELFKQVKQPEEKMLICMKIKVLADSLSTISGRFIEDLQKTALKEINTRYVK